MTQLLALVNTLLFEQMVGIGLASLFGGMLIWVPLGAVIGRFKGFEIGAGTALMLFGSTGLAFAALVAWYLFHETTEVELVRSGCSELIAPAGRRGGTSQDLFQLKTASGATLTLREPGVRGTCAERLDDQPVRLRLRKSALVPGAAGADPLDVDRIDDPRQGVALVGVFGAFGGFGFLGGAILISSTLESRRRSAPEKTISPLRHRLATALNLSANFGLLGSIFFGEAMDWSAGQSVNFVFRAVTVACVLWAAAFALRGRMTVSTVLFFVLIGGGFYLAAASARLYS